MTYSPGEKTRIYGNIAKESGGFALAEGVSMATSLFVVGVADQIAPGLIKGASQVISKICIEPFLDTIEGGLSKVCRLKECQPDMTKSRQERAEAIAKTALVFTAAWGTSMAAKLYTRGVINRLTGVNPHTLPSSGNWFKDQYNAIAAELKDPNTRRVFLMDEAFHYGLIGAMNTVGAPVTDEMINSLSGVFQKAGMSQSKAREVASMAVVWELPNVVGMAAGIGAIASNHMRGTTHVDKLMASREAAAASAHLPVKT